MIMNWPLGIVAIVLATIGLVGQGFEMRNIRVTTFKDEEATSQKIFSNRRNFKWYALIGVGFILWFTAESID